MESKIKTPPSSAQMGEKQVYQNRVPVVLFAGQYQNGKSTLINCILGGDYAVEGNGCHTTAYRTKYSYSDVGTKFFKVHSDGRHELLKDGLSQTIEHTGEDIYFEAKIPSPALKNISLVDAPGWNANEIDDRQAENALQNIDYVIYVSQATQISTENKRFLRLLKKCRKYFSVVVNVRDMTNPYDESLDNICSAIAGTIKGLGLDDQLIQYPSPTGIYSVNLLWAKFGKKLLSASKDFNVCQFFEQGTNRSEILRESGFETWEKIFFSSVDIIKRFKIPESCLIHDMLTTSICSDLRKSITSNGTNILDMSIAEKDTTKQKRR